MWMTWLMKRLNVTMLVHSCCCWCACRATVLLGDGCSCCKVWVVLDGRWVRLMLHSCISLCLYVCMLDSFIHSRKVDVLLSGHVQTHPRMFTRPSMNTSLHDCTFMSTSLCMHCLFVYWRTCPSACTPFVHLIHPCAMFVYVPISVVTHDGTHQIHKPPSLPWCMIVSDAGDRERRQGCELQAGMEALGPAG